MNHPLHQHFDSEWANVAPAWRTWGTAISVQTRAATAWLMELAGVQRGSRILDLASGVGEPALTLASAAGPDGSVVATDLVEGALTMLREHRVPNITTTATSMEQLPFESYSFDVVTSRLGLMFATDLPSTLREIHRVLKPGGRAAFIVWGPPSQPIFESTLGSLPGFEALRPQQDRPGPFRFAEVGTLGRALSAAGFTGVVEEQRVLPWPWPGPPEEMWRAYLELSGSELRDTLESLPTVEREHIHARAIASLRRHLRDGRVDPGATLVGAAGVK